MTRFPCAPGDDDRPRSSSGHDLAQESEASSEARPLPPPAPDVEIEQSMAPYRGGGCMYEGSRCIAKNLPSLKSGDRVRLRVERGFGHMRVWINELELGTTISGFQVWSRENGVTRQQHGDDDDGDGSTAEHGEGERTQEREREGGRKSG